MIAFQLLVGERLAAPDISAITCGMVTARRKAHLRPETATWVRYTEAVASILTGQQEA